MDQPPTVKRGEQYPLLKSDGSGDNNKRTPNSATIVTSGWNVTCTPKKSWCSRWPEFLSACWMTLILLVISFLVFYALGMSVYRRQPLVILKCNDSRPAGNVYYHYIIPKDSNLSFKIFSDYLSYMAGLYPALNIQVYFLMDDSNQKSMGYMGHAIFFRKIKNNYSFLMNKSDMREIGEFQKKYPTVNISVISLSKYMAMTPLQFKWKKISQSYLTFYSRIYEVWRNGGVGFDLLAHNQRFSNLKTVDYKIDAILRQHNDGINLVKYVEVLDSIDNEESNELVPSIFDMLINMIHETSNFFNYDIMTDIKTIETKPGIRTHRSKRSDNQIINKSLIEEHTRNSNDSQSSNYLRYDTYNYTKNNSIMGDSEKFNDKIADINYTKSVDLNSSTLKYDIRKKFKPQIIHVYDFSSFVGGNRGLIPEMPLKSDLEFQKLLPTRNKNKHKNYITLNRDASFVAATGRHHPFLLKLILAGCQKMHPQMAISEIMRKHCSKLISNDSYCDSIRIMNNI